MFLLRVLLWLLLWYFVNLRLGRLLVRWWVVYKLFVFFAVLWLLSLPLDRPGNVDRHKLFCFEVVSGEGHWTIGTDVYCQFIFFGDEDAIEFSCKFRMHFGVFKPQQCHASRLFLVCAYGDIHEAYWAELFCQVEVFYLLIEKLFEHWGRTKTVAIEWYAHDDNIVLLGHGLSLFVLSLVLQ